jgi:hypothetical protein
MQEPGPRRSRWSGVVIAIALWAILVTVGMVLLARYSLGPGRAADAPVVWPASSHLPRDAGRPLLVMVAHPRCSCTRASLSELAILMAHCAGRVSAVVLFVRPPNTTAAWNDTDLRRTAEAIPGVRVLVDSVGSEASRFGAATSGQVFLYDAQGHLQFSGGITAGRGHEGDNPGRTILQAQILGGATGRSTTPVFGCGLFGPDPARKASTEP